MPENEPISDGYNSTDFIDGVKLAYTNKNVDSMPIMMTYTGLEPCLIEGERSSIPNQPIYPLENDFIHGPKCSDTLGQSVDSRYKEISGFQINEYEI